MQIAVGNLYGIHLRGVLVYAGDAPHHANS